MQKHFKIWSNLIVAIIYLSLAFGFCDSDSKSLSTESADKIINNESNTKSSLTCNVCGRKCYSNSYEEQINENFKELEYPYSNQLCSPNCALKASQKLDYVANKYDIK